MYCSDSIHHAGNMLKHSRRIALIQRLAEFFKGVHITDVILSFMILVRDTGINIFPTLHVKTGRR